MMTKIYGASDDLIEFEGDFRGEYGCYGTADEDNAGVMLIFSDGTILNVKYCLRIPGVWGIDLLKKGELFDSIDPCIDEDGDPYSDIAYFRDGIKWAYAAREWARVH